MEDDVKVFFRIFRKDFVHQLHVDHGNTNTTSVEL